MTATVGNITQGPRVPRIKKKKAAERTRRLQMAKVRVTPPVDVRAQLHPRRTSPDPGTGESFDPPSSSRRCRQTGHQPGASWPARIAHTAPCGNHESMLCPLVPPSIYPSIVPLQG